MRSPKNSIVFRLRQAGVFLMSRWSHVEMKTRSLSDRGGAAGIARRPSSVVEMKLDRLQIEAWRTQTMTTRIVSGERNSIVFRSRRPSTHHHALRDEVENETRSSSDRGAPVVRTVRAGTTSGERNSIVFRSRPVDVAIGVPAGVAWRTKLDRLQIEADRRPDRATEYATWRTKLDRLQIEASQPRRRSARAR